jgi:hypothetical protein
MDFIKVIRNHPLEFALGAFLLVLLAITVVYFFTKDNYTKPKKCACSSQEVAQMCSSFSKEDINEGYDIGFIDGVNSVETDIDAEESYNKSAEDVPYDGKWDQSKIFYTRRVKKDGKWVCPADLIDTGMDWGMGPDSARHCRTQAAPQPVKQNASQSCPAGQYYSDYWKKCRFEADRGKIECPPGQWDDGNRKCTDGSKKPASKPIVLPPASSITYNRSTAPNGTGKKYEKTTGSSIISKVGSTCPTLTKEITSGNHKGKCQRTPEWYTRFRGKDVNGKSFTCSGGRVAVGSTCQCDTAGGKLWNGSKCQCDKNRGLKWDNGQKRCVARDGSGRSPTSGGTYTTVKSGSSGCKPGQVRRASDNKCVCATGTKWDGSKCSGSSKQSGGSSGGGSSKQSGGSSGCKPGQYRRTSDNKCVCIPPTRYDNGKCV